MQNIKSLKVEVGKNTFIHPSARIEGVNGIADHIKIGDNCYIGESVQILCDKFSIGDYSKIHHHTNVHGKKTCKIGHNAWIGQYTIIDSTGGVEIGDNCGIGSHSQLWSHIKFGDTLEGCQFFNDKALRIGKDVWFVGHCIVSPVTVKDKAMALVGSVITSDMEYNQIYAGSPAKNISSKIGFQFREVTLQEKKEKMKALLNAFNGSKDNIIIVEDISEIDFEDEKSYFNISNRTYKKTNSDDEIKFMRYLLPEKAKFVPIQI